MCSNIDKNILVYRLWNSNRVLVEFFHASFQVKDISIEIPLLQNKTKNGLYKWHVSPCQATTMVTSSNPKHIFFCDILAAAHLYLF